MENKELTKFVENPSYRQKVIKRVHKDADTAYKQNIKKLEQDEKRLVYNRDIEVQRLQLQREEKYANGKLIVNRTEGKIRFNNQEALFSSIKGADLAVLTGVRTVTKDEDKKHASVGGAVLGGVIGGAPGAIIGGSVLGKTKGTSTSNTYPTCLHLGVNINIDGFISELVLLDTQVDQASERFKNLYRAAQNIISLLGTLANTPVPTDYVAIEEEPSVVTLDEEIAVKRAELEAAKADKPNYLLPAAYRTEEAKDLSDKDYLALLEEEDQKRFSYENLKKIKSTTQKSGATLAYHIIFWILSVAVLLFGLLAIVASGVASTIVFLATAILINPLVTDFIIGKWVSYPKWLPIILLLVGFIVGIMVFPTSDATQTAASETAALVSFVTSA